MSGIPLRTLELRIGQLEQLGLLSRERKGIFRRENGSIYSYSDITLAYKPSFLDMAMFRVEADMSEADPSRIRLRNKKEVRQLVLEAIELVSAGIAKNQIAKKLKISRTYLYHLLCAKRGVKLRGKDIPLPVLKCKKYYQKVKSAYHRIAKFKISEGVFYSTIEYIENKLTEWELTLFKHTVAFVVYFLHKAFSDGVVDLDVNVSEIWQQYTKDPYCMGLA